MICAHWLAFCMAIKWTHSESTSKYISPIPRSNLVLPFLLMPNYVDPNTYLCRLKMGRRSTWTLSMKVLFTWRLCDPAEIADLKKIKHFFTNSISPVLQSDQSAPTFSVTWLSTIRMFVYLQWESSFSHRHGINSRSRCPLDFGRHFKRHFWLKCNFTCIIHYLLHEEHYKFVFFC
jgi:hypothetical protein